MGLGIVVIVLGVVLGALVVVAPRVLGGVGDSAVSVIRLAGMLLMICAVAVGGTLLVLDGLPRDQHAASAPPRYTGPGWPMGQLPVVGYVPMSTPRGIVVDVYYLAPAHSVGGQWSLFAGSGSCTSVPTFDAGEDGGIDVSVELVWTGEGNEPESGYCTFHEPFAGAYKVERASAHPVPTVQTVRTDSPIVTVDNTEVLAAAPGNVVPTLPGAPATDVLAVDGVDLGALPIRDYKVSDSGDGATFLDITYLSPRDPGAGCTVTRTQSGVGSDTVTVGVRLSWSDGGGRFTAADRQMCRNAGPWMTNRTIQWLTITGDPRIVTDGPVGDGQGTVLMPAAPGNPVPERP